MPLLSLVDVDQGLDHVAQRREGLVDAAGLLERLAHGLAVLLPLRPSQVHEVKRGLEPLLQSSVCVNELLLLREDENRVALAAFSVRSGLADVPGLAALLEEGVRLAGVGHALHRPSVHHHAFLRVLTDGDGLVFRLVEKVEDDFIVDLQVGHLGGVRVTEALLCVLDLLPLEIRENVLQNAGKQAARARVVIALGSLLSVTAVAVRLVLALHGVGLSRTRLPVCEEVAVVPIEEGIRQRLTDQVENFLLGGLLVDHVVVREGFARVLVAAVREVRSPAILAHEDGLAIRSARELRAARGPDAHEHFDVLILLRFRSRHLALVLSALAASLADVLRASSLLVRVARESPPPPFR